MRRAALLLLALALGPAAARADAPAADAPTADELSRVAGHTLAPTATLRILDVAGEGAPVVGLVERRGRSLHLVPTDGSRALRLAGPLAVPRIAGPGYKVWALGRLTPDGALHLRRLGVLRRPAR